MGDRTGHRDPVARLRRTRAQRFLGDLGQRVHIVGLEGLHHLAIEGFFTQEVAQPPRGDDRHPGLDR